MNAEFDLSPSDLKQIKEPSWLRADRAAPTLMLFSVVDDRSGVAYQEYRCVYGDDVEAALRFLFNAMSEKTGFPFQGIPQMTDTDNGPIAKSRVFQQVMRYLKIELRTHLPAGGDGRRATARSKGKVERPFRTVKEMHETLYHFHEPSTEEEANAWLKNFLLRYNSLQHRPEPHTRIEDWVDNLPPSGIRAMCSWERFRTFAREADRRKVGIDARVSAEGVSYVVDPALAGETVVLWWGLFGNELYVEHDDQRFGPYLPDGGPIPLNHCRAFKKTTAEKQADRIEDLAARLNISKAALSTPLQFETYLKRAFEEGFNVAQKPVTVEEIESILAKDLNDMKPCLTRYGYNPKVLCEVLKVKPREVRALLRGQLPAGRAQELRHEMLAVGIPI